MNVLVDTSIWSLALRRHSHHLSSTEIETTSALTELVSEGRAQLIGPIRQELLSGIKEQAQFLELRRRLREFEDVFLSVSDYEDAAEIGNRCRKKGITGSPVDFLICATALRRQWAVFSADKDFSHYVRVVPIRLHAVVSK